MQLGWTPKDQWHGNPSDWRPADVWLDRGEMLRNITQLKDKLATTERQVAEAFKKGVQLTETKFKEELAALRAARREAFQEGDLERVDKIEDRIEVLKEQKKLETNKQVPAQNTPPEFPIFLQRNPWYQTNKRLRYMADAIGREYAEAHPNANIADLYFFVEQEMQSSLGTTQKKSPPAPDGGRQTPGRNPGASNGGSFTGIEAQMSDEDRGIMNTLVKTGVFKNKEEYLKEYQKAIK